MTQPTLFSKYPFCVQAPVEMDAPVVDVRAAIANYEQPTEKPNVPKTAFSYTPVAEIAPPRY